MTVAAVSRFAFLLFVAASAAADGAPPKQKGGEWRTERLNSLGNVLDAGTDECFATQSIIAKFDTMPHCSWKDVHTVGNTTTADARCRFEGSVMRWHEKVVKLSVDNFNRDMTISLVPPVISLSTPGSPDAIESGTILFQHLKRLGPCRPDERPIKY